MEADVLDEKGHTKQHERLFYLTARMTGGRFFRENINRKIPSCRGVIYHKSSACERYFVLLQMRKAPHYRGETLLPQRFYTSISIPQVSRKTIRSLLCTVMLSTSPAHRLSSNSVMSSGSSCTLSMNRSIFLRSCCPLPSSECGAGECEGRAALFHISLLYHYFLL